MDERDLAYLRTVAAVIGQEIEKLAFIEQDLGGTRLYSCRTVRADLNAVHTGLKYFIRDRTVPGTVIDPVTHLGTPPVDFETRPTCRTRTRPSSRSKTKATSVTAPRMTPVHAVDTRLTDSARGLTDCPARGSLEASEMADASFQ